MAVSERFRVLVVDYMKLVLVDLLLSMLINF